MYSAISGFLAGAAVLAILAAVTKLGYAVAPALAVAFGTYWVVARYHSQKVEALMASMQEEVAAGRMQGALNILGSGYRYTPWVLFLKSQLDAQVGTLKYINKDFDEAQPLLQSAWNRHWMSKGMLAAYWFRKHKKEQAFEVLDAAIAANKKEAMLYGIKAFMQVKTKDRDGARATLVAGKQAVESSDAITTNLVRLQNGESLQMWLFGESWWNFHLEKPSQKQIMKLAGANPLGGGRGGRKAMYKG